MSKFRQIITVALISLIINLPLLAATPVVLATPETKTVADFSSGYSSDMLEVKFTEDSNVSVVGGQIVGDKQQIKQLKRILNASIEDSSSLFRKSHLKNKYQHRANRETGISVPEVEDYIKIKLSSDVNMTSVTKKLEKLSFVESAFPVALPAPAPAITPDFSQLQTYMTNDEGLDAEFAHQIDGGQGENVTIVDIEYSWNTNHEDLSTVNASDLMAYGTATDPFNDPSHGTAVAGIIAADNNGFGVDGLAPKADFKMVNSYSPEHGWDIANAIYSAIDFMEAGDVLLLEQQAYGPTPATNDFVPVEIIPSVYDAIVTATSMGIIVIEPAGNGDQNLDNTTYYGNKFPLNKPHSGAIVVGASNGCGGELNNSRAYFSTYGSRVDVFADGGCVHTTGYGNLHNGGSNKKYTNSFAGTSSASAIIAGTAALHSSALQEDGVTPTPSQLTSALVSTGLAQETQAAGSNLGNIGVKPQLRQSILLNNKVHITSCYNNGQWFMLHIAKNNQGNPTPEAAQKHAVNLVGNIAVSNPNKTNPVSYVEDGSRCITSKYSKTEIVKLEEISRHFVIEDYGTAQNFSGVLLGYLIVIWTQ